MGADIGLVGLGTMGAALALNIAEKGFPIAVFNRTTAVTHAFVAEAGELAPRLTLCERLEDSGAGDPAAPRDHPDGAGGASRRPDDRGPAAAPR